jgi:hypothetical protein
MSHSFSAVKIVSLYLELQPNLLWRVIPAQSAFHDAEGDAKITRRSSPFSLPHSIASESFSEEVRVYGLSVGSRRKAEFKRADISQVFSLNVWENSDVLL